MKTTNIVLMAGKGKRFADAGYTVSKPLIPVSGKPMILRAVECMPEADQWAFVVRRDHSEDKELMQTLKTVARNVAIMVDPDPVGQLNSCLVAKEYYDNENPMFIGACDFGMVYDEKKYRELIDSANPERPDVVAWSFTKQPNLALNPKAWGWLKQDKGGKVEGVSVKIPISDDPYHDFAITGSFTFTNGKTFLKIAEELMRRGIKVNGEFYVDSMLGLAIEMGYRVRSFPVKYFGWGTPSDLKIYEYWQSYFDKIN